MFPRFEVGIREAKKHFGELRFCEQVRHEFHRVGAQTGDVLVSRISCALLAQCFDPFMDECRNVRSDLQTFRKILGQREITRERDQMSLVRPMSASTYPRSSRRGGEVLKLQASPRNRIQRQQLLSFFGSTWSSFDF